MEEITYLHLGDNVQFKMFTRDNLGRGILFVMHRELGNEELCTATDGYWKCRYSSGVTASKWCWSTDLVYYGLNQAINIYNSNLRAPRRLDARETFYLTFGEELGAEFTEEPKIGNIVLFPNTARRGPKIGIVSRIIRDKKGKARKWWYIAGNEGMFISKVKESRGDNKKIEGFMDVSKIVW